MRLLFRFLHPPELLRSWHFWLRSWIVWIFSFITTLIYYIPIIGKRLVAAPQRPQNSEVAVDSILTSRTVCEVNAPRERLKEDNIVQVSTLEGNRTTFFCEEDLLSPEEPGDESTACRDPAAVERSGPVSLIARVSGSAANLVRNLPFLKEENESAGKKFD